jgi:hypothetical protein
LEDQIPFDPELHDGMAIDTCVENFSGAVLKTLAASTPSHPRSDPQPPILASIQDEIRLKNRLHLQWQVTRDPTLIAEANCLQRSVTRWLNEWRNDQWRAMLESLDPEDQSLWRMTKRVMRVPTLSPPLVTPRESLSHTRRKLKLYRTINGRNAINMGQSRSQPITDRRLLIEMNLVHNVFIVDILCEEAVLVAVYSALRFKTFVFCCIFNI